jgi:glutamyl-tRNA reductase
MDQVNELVFDLLSRVEKSRQKELAEALRKMGNLDEQQKKVVGELTRRLTGELFLPLVKNIRRAALDNEPKIVEVASKLLVTPS